VSEIPRSSGGNGNGDFGRYSGRSRALLALVVLVLIEAAAMAAISGWLVFELLTETPRSVASAVGLIVLAIVAAVFLVAIALGAIRRQPWIRGAALTWQIVQIAVAVGSLQGENARPDIGWALLIPSLLVIGLLLSPGVLRELRRE
jgi:hypothetical protein